MAEIKTIYNNTFAPPPELENYATTEYVDNKIANLITNLSSIVLDTLTLEIEVTEKASTGSPYSISISDYSGTWSNGQSATFGSVHGSGNYDTETVYLDIEITSDKKVNLNLNSSSGIEFDLSKESDLKINTTETINYTIGHIIGDVL